MDLNISGPYWIHTHSYKRSTMEMLRSACFQKIIYSIFFNGLCRGIGPPKRNGHCGEMGPVGEMGLLGRWAMKGGWDL
jgi:hypothetical protein